MSGKTLSLLPTQSHLTNQGKSKLNKGNKRQINNRRSAELHLNKTHFELKMQGRVQKQTTKQKKTGRWEEYEKRHRVFRTHRKGQCHHTIYIQFLFFFFSLIFGENAASLPQTKQWDKRSQQGERHANEPL